MWWLEKVMPRELQNTTTFMVCAIVGILVGIGQVSGQVEPMPTYDLYTPDYQTYRVEKESYSFNAIKYMFQDRNRKLWISSAHDFKRTNGYHFFSLPQVSTGVQYNIDHIIDGQYWNDSTQYLVEENENQVLRSLALYADHPITTYRLDEDQPRGNLLFYDVIWDENAYEIWNDTAHSLMLKVIKPDGSLENNIRIPSFEGTLTNFSVTRDQLWFVVDHQKIIHYTLTKDGVIRTPSQLTSPADINIFHSDRWGNVWVSTWDGVFQIRSFAHGYELTPITDLRNMQVVFEDDFGNLIMGSITFPRRISVAYLYLREGGRWITLDPLIQDLQDLHFFAGKNFQKEFFVGAQNSLSTIRFSEHPLSKDIINRRDTESITGFNARGLYKTDSTFFALAANQGLWIKDLITGNEDLVRFQHPVSREFLRFEQPSTMEVDTLGRLWFTSGERVGSDESKFLIRYNPRSGRKDLVRFPSSVTAIEAGKGSVIWVAAQGDFNTQAITRFDVVEHHSTGKWDIPTDIGRINDLYVLNEDSIFLATDFGLYQYSVDENRADRIVLLHNPKIRTSIFSIFHYDEKYFLAGRDGLFIYTPDDPHVPHYSNRSGLRNNIITAVFRERRNKYWLATLYGVTMLNLDENLVLNYSVRDGLPENEFNIHSYFQDDSGYYLGYYNGVIQLDLGDSMITYFEDFELDHAQLFYRGEEKGEVLLPSGNHLDIPPNVSYLMLFPSSYASYFIDYFHFKLINTTITDTLTFSASNGAILSKLNAGTYTMELKSYDRYGNILPGAKTYTITINEYFYQATWFRVVILLLVNMLLAYLVFLWFRNRNRQRRKAQEQALRLSELELQVLQAQLNPHFIFNTISAIQYYIQDHDDELADRYLTSFSRLMRMYLESSNSSFISLSSEIDLLTNYLELEIMVSDGKFMAHYEADPKLDLDNIVIPTMTIQPFVENAIQHGLFNKEGVGNIYIRFVLLAEDTLLCEVEDDGIGRAEAARINSQNTHKPESRALKIIDDKLEVLKVTRGMDIEIEIIDKHHDGRSMGTLVRITFPVMKRDDVQSLVKT